MIVADQTAGVGGAAVGNRDTAIGGDDVDIKIHEAFAGDGPRLCAHAVCGVANRAGEAILDMPGVLAETGVRDQLIEVVALRAQRVGAAISSALGAQDRVGKQIRNQPAGSGRLTELIPAFHDVGENRPVRSVWSNAAEFPIVVAIVTIGAENARAHRPPVRPAIEIQHGRAKAGLGEHAGAIVEYRVAGSCERTELWNHIQRVAGGDCAHGQIAGVQTQFLARAGAVATQAILILIGGGADHRLAVRRTDSRHHRL